MNSMGAAKGDHSRWLSCVVLVLVLILAYCIPKQEHLQVGHMPERNAAGMMLSMFLLRTFLPTMTSLLIHGQQPSFFPEIRQRGLTIRPSCTPGIYLMATEI